MTSTPLRGSRTGIAEAPREGREDGDSLQRPDGAGAFANAHERDRRLRVAYVMSRFPKLSETFILHEILEVERDGIEVEIHPLLREPETLVHPDAVPLVARAHFLPFVSMAILRAQLHFVRTRRRRYARALLDVVGANWRRPRSLAQTLAILPKVVEHARLIEAARVDHVHAHFANHPATAAYVIWRLTGVPYSFTAHAYEIEQHRSSLPLKVRHAAFVAPISEFNRRLIIEACGGRWADRIRVIHCGVDTTRFRPRQHVRPATGRLDVLSVGRLEPVKGHRFLVEAVRLARASGRDVRAMIVGDGSLRTDLERQVCDAGLEDSITLAGPRTADEVVERMRAADAFVLPSIVTPEGRREGIPVGLMEAMSTEVPVVSTRTSGIPELISDDRDGLLVPPEDPQALAAALVRLHDDPALRARLGSAGRRTVEAGFDIRANTRTKADAFRAAVAVRSAGTT